MCNACALKGNTKVLQINKINQHDTVCISVYVQYVFFPQLAVPAESDNVVYYVGIWNTLCDRDTPSISNQRYFSSLIHLEFYHLQQWPSATVIACTKPENPSNSSASAQIVTCAKMNKWIPKALKRSMLSM